MISIEALSRVKTIIAHDACSDGTASALILQDALRREDWAPEVRFVQYGTDGHKTLPAESGMIFCDFSPPVERVQEFVDAQAIVLDHHATARPVVEAFGPLGLFGDEKADPGVSGAVLAYRVWETVRYPTDVYRQQVATFARLAGIRDTWQRKDPAWPLACQQGQVLAFAPNTFWLDRGLALVLQEWEHTWAPIGKILYDRQQKEVQKAAQRAWKFQTPRGTTVAILTSKGLVSDAAELVEADMIVGLGFAYEPHVDRYPKLVLSTRTRGDYDCKAFCKMFEGGGHTKAAGCSVDLDPQKDPFQQVEAMVVRYEATLNPTAP